MNTSVLGEADSLINGDRQGSYGHAIDNFGRIIICWNAHLQMRAVGMTDEELVAAVRGGTYLREEDHGWMMVDVKKCREENKRQRDNKVDAVGYVGLMEHIEDERARRAAGDGGYPRQVLLEALNS